MNVPVQHRAPQFPANDPQAIAYALQGERLHLGRITSDFQRNRVANGLRRNDLMALRFAFPAS